MEGGVYAGTNQFARSVDGVTWATQYTAAVSSTFYYYTDFTVLGLLYIRQEAPVVWSGTYTF